MIPEVGHFSLILALCLVVMLAAIPLAGTFVRNNLWMSLARPLAAGQFVFVLFSFICLVQAFLSDDFSVRYVADNSNSLLPWYYKFSAVWGAHEGSLLLWMLTLSSWILAVAVFSRDIPLVMVARVLSVMGMVALGFCLFLLFTSNPFERALPFPPGEGRDLNPLLQDIGLIIHPPLLYMGYVGFSVPFAFALAALIAGRFDAAWVRWTRLWANTAWAFLTLGIALGSWWAYYELGWGGWWFWDPVENASFMPWLAGTALIHSLAVSEKRGIFRSWSLLLAIFTFSLSLLGTFLVRSGVLTSVHAFASDPTRGVFILIFLGIVVGGSLFVYGLRGQTVRVPASFTWLSREAFLLFNNILLVVITAIILLGTLYPLFADVMGWGKISVGPPYFDFFFIPVAVLVALFLAPGSVVRWKNTEARWLKMRLLGPAVVSLAVGVAIPLLLFPKITPGAVVSVGIFFWVLLFCGQDMLEKSAHSQGRFHGLRRLTGSYYGMQLAHFGVACAILGGGLTSIYSEEKDARVEAGSVVELGEYSFLFDGSRAVEGPNYVADEVRVTVARPGGNQVAVLYPQKRRYSASNQVMTEAGIAGGLWRDIYVSLGEPLGEGAWAVRVHVKPFVRWIWLGALLMALGGTLAMFDKRYRATRVKADQSLLTTVP